MNGSVYECNVAKDFINAIKMLIMNHFLMKIIGNYYLDSFSEKTNNIMMDIIENLLNNKTRES